MSMESKDRCGRIVGSEEYFRDLNMENAIGALMHDNRKCNYYDTFRQLSGKIHETLDEICGDLKSNCDIIRYIPQKDRDNLDSVISGLMEVCRITNDHIGRAKECRELLSLRTTATKKQSRATDREIEQGVKLVLGGKQLNKRERIETLRRAVEFGERRAIGNSKEKAEFLQTLMDGKKSDFLADVWASLDYDTNSRKMTGKCGQELCGKSYIDHIEQHIFGRDMPNYYSGWHGNANYKSFYMDKLAELSEILRKDLKDSERDNDYITDESAARIKIAIAELERCGVKYGGSRERIDRLAWFVGGDPQQIRELQRMLNELGIEGDKGKLKVDGVYGRETHIGWRRFLERFETGVVPSLAWIDPLQTDLTGLKADVKITKNGKNFSQIMAQGAGKPVFRADVHSYNGVDRYFHINVDAIPNANPRQIKLATRYDHFEISEDAYNALKNFDNIAKPVRVVGKVLLAAGLVLDALELGLAITEDLKDTDKKLGKPTATASAVASIGGRWAGGLAGAKLGAMAGAAVGTALALPGPGTAAGVVVGGVFLGIVGAIGGDTFANWVLDVSCLED